MSDAPSGPALEPTPEPDPTLESTAVAAPPTGTEPAPGSTPAADPAKAGRVSRDQVRRAGGGSLWILIAVAFAVGVAGIATAENAPPGKGGDNGTGSGTGSRPELTWPMDRVVDPALDGATNDLSDLTDSVSALGTIGRQALGSILDGNTAAIQSAIGAGDRQLTTIQAMTDALRARLAAVPGIGPDDVVRVGAAERARYDVLHGALGATDGLAGSWSTFTSGSLAAITLTTSLSDHDVQAGEADRLGAKGRYSQALGLLDKADADLARARLLRNQMAVTIDVSILDAWISRNAAFDTAARKTWSLLIASKGKVTAAVVAAFNELKLAQANLPPDTRALVVIMADVARGGINRAVIEIEQVRGVLNAALDAATPTNASPGPSASPSPSLSPSSSPSGAPSAGSPSGSPSSSSTVTPPP